MIVNKLAITCIPATILAAARQIVLSGVIITIIASTHHNRAVLPLLLTRITRTITNWLSFYVELVFKVNKKAYGISIGLSIHIQELEHISERDTQIALFSG